MQSESSHWVALASAAVELNEFTTRQLADRAKLSYSLARHWCMGNPELLDVRLVPKRERTLHGGSSRIWRLNGEAIRSIYLRIRESPFLSRIAAAYPPIDVLIRSQLQASTPPQRSTEYQFRAQLVAKKDDRIIASSKNPADVDLPKKQSKIALLSLKEEIRAIRPFDMPPLVGDNRTEVAISADAFSVLEATVDSALALHEAKTMTERICEALQSLQKILREFQALLEQLKLTTLGLFGLIVVAISELNALLTLLAR